MALIFDSDEEGEIKEMLDDEDNDDDDDDYVPDGRHSDSDAGYGRRKKKTATRYVPGKRNRSSRSSSTSKSNDLEIVEETGDDDADDDETTSPVKPSPVKPKEVKIIGTKSPVPKSPIAKTLKPHIAKSPVVKSSVVKPPIVVKSPVAKSPVAKSPKPKKRRKSSFTTDSVTSAVEDSPSSLRRSSRSSTRTREISYADADVSEEDMFEDEDLFLKYGGEDFGNVSKKNENKTKHVEELWSKFKTDVNKKEKVSVKIEKMNNSEKENESETTSTVVQNGGSSDISKEPSNTTTTATTTSKTKPEEEILKKEIDNSPSLKDSEDVSTEVEKISTEAEKISTETQSPTPSPKLLVESSIVTVTPQESPVVEEKCPPVVCLDEYKHHQTENVDENKDICIQKPNVTGNGSNKSNEGSHVTIEKDEFIQSEQLEDNRNTAIPKKEIPVNIARNEDAPESFLPSNVPNVMPRIPTEICHPSKKFKMDSNRFNAEQFGKKINARSSPGITNFLSSGVKKSGGLSSVLNTIEKKKKITILDKTKCDWESYKSEADIEEELKGNRNAGYLDRQEFLQRVDYKQWENEREMRLYSNRK